MNKIHLPDSSNIFPIFASLIKKMKRKNVINVLKELPGEFPLDDLMERLVVIEKIDKGLQDVKEKRTVSHAKVHRVSAISAGKISRR
jgi:hypothetical protein